MNAVEDRSVEGSIHRNARSDFFELLNFLTYYEEFNESGYLVDSIGNWRCAAQILNAWRKVHDDLTPDEQAWVEKMSQAINASWARVNPKHRKEAA